MATVIGQNRPLGSDVRPFQTETIPEGYGLSKEIDDFEADKVPSTLYYDENTDTQQVLNTDIKTDYYDRNKKADRLIKSDDTLDNYDIKPIFQAKNPSQGKQYEPNKPHVNIQVLKPFRNSVKVRNLYYRPYDPLPRSGPLLQLLSNHRNNDEVIQQIIATGRNNISLENKNKLKNAFLTKFTSYNITQLSGDKHNESFLLEKKDNSSSDLIYVNSKNISTNYSDVHSSLLKTVIIPERQRNDSYVDQLNNLSPTLPTNKTRKKIKVDSEYNQEDGNKNSHLKPELFESNILSDDKSSKNHLNLKNKEYTNSHPAITTNNDVHQIEHWNDSERELHSFIPKGNQNVAFDFVGGQYVRHFKQNTSSLDSTVPNNTYKSPNQFFENVENTLGNHQDFVGGQFIDSGGRIGNTVRVSPTVIAVRKPVGDFVGGQFIKYHKNETSTTKYADFEESSRGDNNKTFMPTVTPIKDFETQPLDTESRDPNNTYVEELNFTKDFNDSSGNDYTTKKDLNLILEGHLNDSNLHDKESTLQNDFLEQYTSPALKDEYPTTIYHTTQEILEDVSNVISEKDSTFVQKTLKDKFDTTPILDIPHTLENKNNDMDSVPVLSEDKTSFNYVNTTKTVKIGKPIIIPYSRPRMSYEIVLPYSKVKTRPIKVVSVGNKIYIPHLPQDIIESSRPLTLSPNSKNNVVFKTKDDDNIEVIISVSTSSDDKLINQLLLSEGNSSDESQRIMYDVVHPFLENNQSTQSSTIKSNIKIENETSSSEYEQYEEDDVILGNPNSNKTDSIILMNPNSNNYYTEIVENYFKTELSTEPNNVFERVNLDSPPEPNTTVDNIVGDSSNLLLEQFISQNVTPSNLPNTNNTDKTNASFTSILDTSKVTENVELYAGSSLNIPLNDTVEPNFQSPDNMNVLTEDNLNNDKNTKSHLADLCLPLTKEKYFSLLDLLSRPFYVDRNGNKITISIRDDQSKNCSLNSKQCKLFLNLKNMTSSLNQKNSTKFDKDYNSPMVKHEKRHISNERMLELYPKELPPENYKTNLLLRDFIQNYLKPRLEDVLNKGLPSSRNTIENEQRIQVFSSSSDEPPTKFDLSTSLTTVTTVSNENVHDILSYGSASKDHKQFDLENYPSKQLFDEKPHKTRSVRMIENGGSNEGEKCGCGENQILKSPSPFPNYKQFVAKRYDILKNIVHTVNDWAAG